ncbi:CoB--CoM heterodisulfide reductase iron-sulfur subunit B family protein [Dehalococcoidia bacterium]|nr:CoB--CoM heterodisulfide reductase iron-sulfur subunit B family protein [Dehalococcoidia bacterium]
MMNLSYYPGCTLKTKAKNFEDSAIASMSTLGIDLIELPRWNCCGASYCLADDDLIHQVAPVRDLIRVKEQSVRGILPLKSPKVVTLCPFCYNTLKRANLIVKNDPSKKDTLNSFMDEEIDYQGEVETVHLLEVLRDDVGWEAIAEKVKVPLKGLVVAPYYGCTLIRPREIAIDDVERPTVLHRLMETLGATVVDFPLATECCGSFQSVSNPELAAETAWNILTLAQRQGAEVLVLSCPLCEYNLGFQQKLMMKKHGEFKGIPTPYFTQLLALALGAAPESCGFDQGYTEDELSVSRALLQSKGLLS